MCQLTTIAMTGMSLSFLRHKILPPYTDPDSILNDKEKKDNENIYPSTPLTQNGKKCNHSN